MLPLQQRNEKSFQLSFDPSQQIIPEDLILSHAPMDGYIAIKALQKREVHTTSDYLQKNSNDHTMKLIHREMERQRREQMSSLYASLRSLLPIEYIKGKRAISDYMNEAVNYIKHLKKRVKEKEAKRDEIKKLNNSNNIGHEKEDQSYLARSITIHSSNNGVQIMITSGSNGFPLSRVMKVLFQEGLDGAVNIVSTKVNQKLLHSIQIQVIDKARMDHPQLQQKLLESITSLKQSK